MSLQLAFTMVMLANTIITILVMSVLVYSKDNEFIAIESGRLGIAISWIAVGMSLAAMLCAVADISSEKKSAGKTVDND